MTTERTPKKVPAEAGKKKGSHAERARAERETLDWRISAFKLETENLDGDARNEFSGDEKWDLAKRGAKAIALANEQTVREMRHPVTDDEQGSNYFVMKHLHMVARDGYVALFWLVQELFDNQSAAEIDARKELAKLAAMARLANDPKQLEMTEIKAQWVRWQNGEAHYKSDADFARKMMRDAVHLTSEGSIQNAVTRWRKESSS